MDEKTHQPIEITPHFFQLGLPSFPVYLSMGTEGMLIEGGTASTSDIIADQIHMLGIDPRKIKYMALTHTHGDHVGAVPRLRPLWPDMKVLAGPIGAKILKKDAFIKGLLPADRMISDILIQRGDITAQPPPIDDYKLEADAVIAEGDHIDLGGDIVWQVYETPGHSSCHISLYENKERIMAIGDMTGYYDPERDLFWPNYFSSLEAYCDSIRKMAALPALRGALSHNGVREGNIKGFFKKALEATESYHHEMLSRLDEGEDQEKICTEKADWVCSLGALASYKAIFSLCKVLLKNSVAEQGKDHFFFTHSETA